MDTSNLIFIVEALTERGGQILRHPRNAARYVPPVSPVDTDHSSSTTPNTTPESDEDESGESETQTSSSSKLHFKFDQPPASGLIYVFGSDPKKCDVYIGSRREGICAQHFIIYFDQRHRLVLQDVSKSGSILGFGPKGELHKRKDFLWILFRNVDIFFATKKTRPFFKFRVEYNTSHQAQYLGNFSRFLRTGFDRATILAPTNAIAKLAVRNYNGTSTGSLLLSPIRDPHYHFITKVGSGGFGTVHKVVNVSTGHIYVAKRFETGQAWQEVRLLKKLSHPYVVRFVGSEYQDGEDLLLMEYVTFGSMRDASQKSKISKSEALQCLLQGLSALHYLKGQNITHRDVKPENILVHYREGGHIKTKLADFGLSKDRSYLVTKGGTPVYAPPETFEDENMGRYSPFVVDTWSLGVVFVEYHEDRNMILQYQRHHKLRGSHRTWCQWLEAKVKTIRSERLDDPIFGMVEGMVLIDTKARLSASECLKSISNLPSRFKACRETLRLIGNEPVSDAEPPLWDNDPEPFQKVVQTPDLCIDLEKDLKTEAGHVEGIKSSLRDNPRARDVDASNVTLKPHHSPHLDSEEPTVRIPYSHRKGSISQPRATIARPQLKSSTYRSTARRNPQHSILAPVRGDLNCSVVKVRVRPRPDSIPLRRLGWMGWMQKRPSAPGQLERALFRNDRWDKGECNTFVINETSGKEN